MNPNCLSNYENKDGKVFDLNIVHVDDKEKYNAFCEMFEGVIGTNAIFVYLNEVKIYDIGCEKKEYLGDWISSFKEDLIRSALCYDIQNQFFNLIIKRGKKVDIEIGWDDISDIPWKFTYYPEEKKFVANIP